MAKSPEAPALMSESLHTPRPLEETRPFRTSHKRVAPTAARVEGQLPVWLRGELVRVCPSIFELPGWRASHWFDALGLLYSFKFTGEGVSFRCRPLESEAARRALQGEQPYATFDTRIQRSLWQKLKQPAAQATDNANVNVVRYGSDWVALTETPFPLIIDPADLSVKAQVSFADRYPKRSIMIAHPQYDFARAKVVNLLIYLGPLSYVAFYEHDGPSRVRKELARLYFQRLPYVHSFGMTDHHLILVSHPHRMLPASLLWSNKGFIEAFEWQPESGTEIHVFDRRSARWQKYEADPFFVFHIAHAHEEGGEIILDLAAHDSAQFISEYRVENLKRQLPEIRSRLRRLRLKKGQGRAQLETLSESRFEFPSVSYRRQQGRPARWIWGAAPGSDGPRYLSPLLSVDLQKGETLRYLEEDVVFGEPIFVGRPGSDSEADGVILAVGSHMKKDLTICVVLDAKSFAPEARVEIDCAVPLGFHGSFFPDSV